MKIIDSIDGFFSWYKDSISLSENEKISTFKTKVYSLDPAFYDYKYKDFKERKKDVNQYILGIFTNFKTIQERFMFLYTNLQKNIEEGLSKFNKQFKDFVVDIPIHICYSLGDCDGATRVLDGEDVLVIGIDVMTQAHNWDNEIPFVQHELFHIYHLKLYPHTNTALSHEDTIFRGLWTEGLATYISHILNPSASYIELALDVPKNLIKNTEANFVAILQDLLKNFYSTDSAVYDNYFLITEETKFPSRCGYYLGFLLVNEIAKKYSLEKLIRLQEAEYVPELITNIKQLLLTNEKGLVGERIFHLEK